ncbi:peptidase, S9A/B/C family, catalytic domain protein [Synechococcus sp. PCC 7335]|uniref:S9 family peptidase n=1 Tax=Synechococcus sp. (strain ATCC 29403 / PCC 7335) TaxID=91464 RepID=UPI00017EB0EB|nr:S9 family peptidase [Synechococcus sp. PCC 7335]EDX87880.1 peptidase, S9A/B/C family, catalytic domain protein [Synechococcus sp. PCC 7335]
MVQTIPHGSWKSPITSDLIVSSSIRLGAARLDGPDIYWSELRPTEGGNQRIVRYGPEDPLGSVTEITPASVNVRTRVHEYGGGAYVIHQGTVYFSNFADQRLYCQRAGEDPFAITPAVTPAAGLRYADMVVDAARERLICVVEDHRQSGEAINAIATVPLSGGLPKVIVSGNDFYSSPRLSPDGTALAWITWNHPQMPWDGTELWLAEITEDGSLSHPRHLVGNTKESVCQPKWSPAGTLHFISDATGWWNLYRWEGERGEPLFPMEAEFAGPQWSFGQSSYGFVDNRHILCTYQYQGETKLAELNTLARSMDEIAVPYSGIGSLQVGRGYAVFLGASTDRPSALVRLNLETAQITEVRRSSSLEIDPGYLSKPTVISFPTTGGFNAYGIYYPPQNKDFEASVTERPPLLVKTHGGPTASASSALNPSIQYWTSRGFAVLDVNYGGSSGYGRAYRNRLQKRWGIVDVDDAVNGALYLVEQGKADRDRLAIDGGSAGGYTTLATLTFRDVFKAGASYYGVSDMSSLAAETHKFESRYLDSLVGPYPAEKSVYEARSPINAVDQLSCPIIFFQGSEDRIVPPNQAETMVNALKQKGIPVAYLLFEGEQHGFRKAENIKRALDAELSFYAQIFSFELADNIEPVDIAGIDSWTK